MLGWTLSSLFAIDGQLPNLDVDGSIPARGFEISPVRDFPKALPVYLLSPDRTSIIRNTPASPFNSSLPGRKEMSHHPFIKDRSVLTDQVAVQCAGVTNPISAFHVALEGGL